VEADVTGLLTYCNERGWHKVTGFVANFGIENAENVQLHMEWENAAENHYFENTISIGHLGGHEFYPIDWSKYLYCSNSWVLTWTYEVTWD